MTVKNLVYRKKVLDFRFGQPEVPLSESEEDATVESESGLFFILRSGTKTRIQIYPQLLGNMASETIFDPWKVVFS